MQVTPDRVPDEACLNAACNLSKVSEPTLLVWAGHTSSETAKLRRQNSARLGPNLHHGFSNPRRPTAASWRTGSPHISWLHRQEPLGQDAELVAGSSKG